MFRVFDEERRIVQTEEMLNQMEDIYTDLKLEYLEMARSYDEAMSRIEELEADKIYLEELLEEASKGGDSDGL